jgi:hypothetical protein
MDEQGIYCPQCRAYVHFWLIPVGGRRFGSGSDERPLPGTLIEMPKACGRCGHKGTYKTTDLRTRRVPTTPALGVAMGPTWRIASTIGTTDDGNTPGPA